MRHGYVIFDNDSPLLLAIGKPQAEAALRAAKAETRETARQRVAGRKPEEQYTVAEQRELSRLLDDHFLFYSMVPFYQEEEAPVAGQR